MLGKKNLIMVVDDEPQIRKLLNISLESEGYKIEKCANGGEAIKSSAIVKPDLIILDLGLPDMDGKDVLKSIREYSEVPIIVCSVRNNDKEIVKTFDFGADDYITKPFNIEVLLARVKANLRKKIIDESGESVLINKDIKIDLVKREVTVRGEISFLTPKEYDVLCHLMINKGKMLTHKDILKKIWGSAHEEYIQYLRVYVKQIREKIEEDAHNPAYIINEPGIGYRMENFEE